MPHKRLAYSSHEIGDSLGETESKFYKCFTENPYLLSTETNTEYGIY